ncbi:DUF3558 domain-containing protein [Streptomyces sp. WMMC905]|uniref:DUF3558 domain-containing protein n=1 Tax=Streptomyces sp. WMMC905 TaxID=3404123 RepID=UPI003B964104
MRRKAHVSGAAALLAALLTACTTGSSGEGRVDDANPGGSQTAARTAEPGRYRTLPDACAAVPEDTLSSLLPGIRQIADTDARAAAYEGEPTLTFDTDRKVGCRWSGSSTEAVHHLFVDLERVVSYDTAVSDDDQARALFTGEKLAADIAEPSAAADESPQGTASASPDDASTSPSPLTDTSASAASASAADTMSAIPTPSELQPRTLDGLGDEAFVDDSLDSAGTAERRTVTVAFRTSNVIVTVEYVEQSTTPTAVPDSEELQDRARKLAALLADALGG